VYELSASGNNWSQSVLYSFTGGSDGANPVGGLIFDRSGNLYGTTARGGLNGGGTAFELMNSNGSWSLTVLYSFSGRFGPTTNLTADQHGNLYGTTNADGAYGYGNVFELSYSNGSWTYLDLHDFTGGSDGANPVSNVVIDAGGNLYGTTTSGGNGYGVVWEITR